MANGNRRRKSKVVRTVLHRIGICAVFVAMGWPVTASKPLTARASPVFGLGPADVVIHAFIEPDARNRSVSFVVESSSFYSSSTVEVPGDRAARARDVRFRMLPAGSYEVRVTLVGTEGERDRVILMVNLL
jgi:hypothetical protein